MRYLTLSLSLVLLGCGASPHPQTLPAVCQAARLVASHCEALGASEARSNEVEALPPDLAIVERLDALRGVLVEIRDDARGR